MGSLLLKPTFLALRNDTEILAMHSHRYQVYDWTGGVIQNVNIIEKGK